MRWTRRRAVLMSLAAIALVSGLVAPLASSFGPVNGVDERVVLPSGRAYILHVPPRLQLVPQLAEGRPAMIVLHPIKNGPADIARSTGFNRLADRDGVYVAYPEGVRQSFNAGLCCEDAAAFGVDDVGFLSRVVTDLQARGASRVSVVGFSNGAMMAYRLACERPALVDTVGVMSGTLEIPHCAGPIRALHLHGLNDTAVPFTGERYSPKLRTFLRDVRTIKAAAPGSVIDIRPLARYGHRWTEPGDAVDATAEFWAFARMSATR